MNYTPEVKSMIDKHNKTIFIVNKGLVNVKQIYELSIIKKCDLENEAVTLIEMIEEFIKMITNHIDYMFKNNHVSPIFIILFEHTSEIIKEQTTELLKKWSIAMSKDK